MSPLADDGLREIRAVLDAHIAREEMALKHIWIWIVVLMACAATTCILVTGLYFLRFLRGCYP